MSTEADLTPLAEWCTEHFANRIAAAELDICLIPEEHAIEIQTDAWTLHLAGEPPHLAFVAIEDEPEDASALTTALHTALDADDIADLRALNTHLDGALGGCLLASRDPLSKALADLLGR